MSRLPHGRAATSAAAAQLKNTSRTMKSSRRQERMLQPTKMESSFDYMFWELQRDPDAFLPETPETVSHLKELGRAMVDPDKAKPLSSNIPSLYTYFGQFLDHEISFEARSKPIPKLTDSKLTPMSRELIQSSIYNGRSPRLDLNSIYGETPEWNVELRDGARMRLGKVATREQGGGVRPPGKEGDDFDVPRRAEEKTSPDDDGPLIGEPRNDENIIITQLHAVFLRAHNALIDRGYSYEGARVALKQHFQWVVLHDYLMRIVDHEVVRRVRADSPGFLYRPPAKSLYLPLEFSAAAFRFGHSMVRDEYRLNRTTDPIKLNQLFTQTAFQSFAKSGEPSINALPESWILEWEYFLDGAENQSRQIRPSLSKNFGQMRDREDNPLPESFNLAVLDLLRGYLLRIPTGQAVAQYLRYPVLTPEQIESVVSPAQVAILKKTGLSTHTPLWYYILAEPAVRKQTHLGPVGGTIVATVLIELIRQSEDSILRQPDWRPSLGASAPSRFTLADLLKLGGVLPKPLGGPVIVAQSNSNAPWPVSNP
jgi:hypothetical protein